MSQPRPLIKVVSAAIMDRGCYLITQRNASAVLPLFWEFPGGRVEVGETDEAALQRELHYRLGIQPLIYERLNTTEKSYADYTVRLSLFRCELGSIAPQALMVRDLRWVRSCDFDAYNFTPADQASMDALLFGRPLVH